MGNNLDNGFQRIPNVYLRDLRKKTDRRYRNAKQEKGVGIYKAKQQQIVDGEQLSRCLSLMLFMVLESKFGKDPLCYRQTQKGL